MHEKQIESEAWEMFEAGWTEMDPYYQACRDHLLSEELFDKDTAKMKLYLKVDELYAMPSERQFLLGKLLKHHGSTSEKMNYPHIDYILRKMDGNEFGESKEHDYKTRAMLHLALIEKALRYEDDYDYGQIDECKTNMIDIHPYQSELHEKLFEEYNKLERKLGTIEWDELMKRSGSDIISHGTGLKDYEAGFDKYVTKCSQHLRSVIGEKMVKAIRAK